MYYFISDEHYGHKNIIKYENRPFETVEEMNKTIISNHNEVVGKNDITVHAGDFTLGNKKYAASIITQLNGNHIFIEGSHDSWLNGKSKQIWERRIQEHYFVVCHYAMRVWSRSHYNSIQLFGHSHGNLKPIGKQWDLSVENNNYYPLSENQILEIMKNRPDNPNLIKQNS